jgi:hypothetical protein
VLVLGENIGLAELLEKEIVKLLKSRDIKANGITKEVAFSRTEEDLDRINEKLNIGKFNEIMYVKIGIFCEDDINFSGTKFRGKCQPYTQYDQSRGSFRYSERNMLITSRIDDIINQSGIWDFQFTVSAQGDLFVRDEAMIQDALNAFDRSLVKDGIIKNKKYEYPID